MNDDAAKSPVVLEQTVLAQRRAVANRGLENLRANRRAKLEQLAGMSVEATDPVAALEHYEKAIDIDPKSWLAWRRAGEASGATK